MKIYIKSRSSNSFYLDSENIKLNYTNIHYIFHECKTHEIYQITEYYENIYDEPNNVIFYHENKQKIKHCVKKIIEVAIAKSFK